jgi:ADP-heptose:LPS heptosyltransferase
VFTGSAAEAALVESARARMPSPSVSLAGQLGLGELGALLSSARVLVSNNTGPVHIASALGTPVAVLYALTNPQHTPWLVPSRVLFHDVGCRFCYKSVCPEAHHACLEQVGPEQVVDAVRQLMCAESRASVTNEAPIRLFMQGR